MTLPKPVKLDRRRALTVPGQHYPVLGLQTTETHQDVWWSWNHRRAVVVVPEGTPAAFFDVHSGLWLLPVTTHGHAIGEITA